VVQSVAPAPGGEVAATIVNRRGEATTVPLKDVLAGKVFPLNSGRAGGAR
jgi:hypothetical protein